MIRRIATVPLWDDSPAAEGQLRVRIGAGATQAVFGLGGHETTSLALALLGGLYADAGPRPARVLDVGSGTGVLGIACAMLGAAEVRGIDIEPESPGVAGANAALNGVAAQCSFDCTPLADVRGEFDLVLANLPSAELVSEFKPLLLARARAGGLLVLSGIRAAKLDALLPHYQDRDVRTVASRGDWRAVLLRNATARG